MDSVEEAYTKLTIEYVRGNRKLRMLGISVAKPDRRTDAKRRRRQLRTREQHAPA